MNETAGTASRSPAETIRLGLLSLSLVVILAPPARSQDAKGLLGHWKLDENGQGELVADASPNQWHGTRVRAIAECSVPGKLGQAFRFPAAGTVRLDRHAPALGKLTDFTLSMWIQYEGGASRQLFTFSDGTLSHRLQVEVHNDCLHFGWQNGGSFAGFGTEKTHLDARHVVSRRICQRRPSGQVDPAIERPRMEERRQHAFARRLEIARPAGRDRIAQRRVLVPGLRGRRSAVRLRRSRCPSSWPSTSELQGPPADPRREAAKTALVEQETARQSHGLFVKAVQEDARLSASERQRQLDWLFQAEEDGLATRTDKELVWTRELIERLQARRKRGPEPFAGPAQRVQRKNGS